MEAHVLRIVSRGKTPAAGRLEHLPKLWLHAPVRFELACAAPEDTEAALDDTPTYSISIHSLDASRNPVDSPLVWYSEVSAEGNTDKSKGPHAVFELSAADIANVTEAGEYWLAFHAYSGGERIVRAAGYLTFADDGFPTDPPTPTPPGTVYLTQAAGDARYVLDPGVVVDNRLVRWDGVSGNNVQSSLVAVDDSGNVSTPGSVTAALLNINNGSFEGEITANLLTGDRAFDFPDSVIGVLAVTPESDGKVKLIDLKDVTITTPTTGHVLTWNGTVWVNSAPTGGGGGGGSVTITGQDGIGVAGSPGTSITLSLGAITPDSVTSAGVIAADGGLTVGTAAEKITFSVANVGAASTVYLPEFGGNLAVVSGINGAILASDVADGTTVGRNILKLTNPGAVTFLRMNADNTVTALSDSSMRSALGLGNVSTRNVGTTAGTAAAGDDARFHTAFSINGALAPVFTLTGQSLGPSATLTADGLVFWDQSTGQFDVITLPGTSTTHLRGDGTFATTFNPASPGAIGGTTASTGVFTQLDVRTELDVQSASGTAGPILVWNTGTNVPTDWERARIQWVSNVLIIGTQRNGTGVARAVDFQTGGTTRMTLGASGGLSFANGNSVTINGSAGGRTATLSYSSVSGALNTANEGGYGSWLLQCFGSTLVELTNQTTSRVIFSESVNMVFGTTTGTRIGTATNQRLGFWNATPAVQPTAVADATDAATVITQLNALLARLRTIGIIAT